MHVFLSGFQAFGVSRLVTQNSTTKLPTEGNRYSNYSASKSITSTEDISLSEEYSSTDYDFSEVSSDTEDYLPGEGSGTSIDSSGDDSDDTNDSYSEEYYDNKDHSSTDNEFDALADDDKFDVTSPLPVTTTEEFIFEETASTTVANEDAAEKAASSNQAISYMIIIVVSVFAVILLVTLQVLVNIYCVPRKSTQEKDGADQTFITVDKFMTTKNQI